MRATMETQHCNAPGNGNQTRSHVSTTVLRQCYNSVTTVIQKCYDSADLSTFTSFFYSPAGFLHVHNVTVDTSWD